MNTLYVQEKYFSDFGRENNVKRPAVVDNATVFIGPRNEFVR